MRMEAWSMSARLAWNRPWFRALSLFLALFALGVCVLYVFSMQPAIRDATTVVFHSNVYVGIDDVRHWPWLFLWPSVWLISVIAGILGAYGVYQRDSLLAYSVLAWLLVWSCPWAIGLYYLFLFTTR